MYFLETGTIATVFSYLVLAAVISILLNVLNQILFPKRNQPPVVFHWVPWLGSAIEYGMDPFKFYSRNRQKASCPHLLFEIFAAKKYQYGDIFTFVLLGRPTTVCLGRRGNDFVFNSKLEDVSAEEVYNPLTLPMYGKGVAYDCTNAVFLEQKRVCIVWLSLSSLWEANVPSPTI